MKTKFFTTIFAMLLAFTSFAKYETTNEDGGFGIKGGIGLSNIYYKNADATYTTGKNKITIAGMIDLSYEHRFNKVFAIEPGVAIAFKGGAREFNNNLNGEIYRFDLHTQTIDIPLHAKFYIGDHFNLYTGPYVSFVTGAWGKFTRFNNENNKVSEQKGVNIMQDKYADANGNKAFNRVDAGMNFGLEYISTKGLIIGARLSQGFLDVTNNNYKGYIGSDAIVLPGDNKWAGNTMFQTYVGIRF